MLTSVIEQYLKTIDRATFQKMMNHLLHLEGFKFIGSPGSVIGKNKTSKGSPDSFFEDGENFAFCELTTQEKIEGKDTFFDKLKKDVDHCFDTTKTGIPKNQISKVILCFIEEIKPSEFATLKSMVQAHNAAAELFTYSIQDIPFKILYYPGFSEKYIPGVRTTKGTLYTLPDFLVTTTKGLQPSLENTFSGRKDELAQAQTFLSTVDLLVVTGVQGVGKSKIGVELLHTLEGQGYEPRVIVSSPVPLWDDLQTFLLPNHKYAILFDDSNKALPNLDYLLQFINQRDAGTIKVIMTVRDYVRRDLDRLLVDRRFQELHISILKEDQLREIIRNSTPHDKYVDPLVIDRIIGLANGNARLALMALKSAFDPAAGDYLRNVAALYDQYFSKVATEASFITNREKLKALGILSFFQVLNRNDIKQKDLLEKHFNINWSALWEIFSELEQAELVDLFANEMVKISDQVLNTYAFYKTFFDPATASIDYDKWILVFLKDHGSKLRKSLIDCINTFGFTELRSTLIGFLLKAQPSIADDFGLQCEFYSCFWFYKEADTLLFIQAWINTLKDEKDETEEATDNYEFTFSEQSIGNHHPVLDLLYNFWSHDTPYTEEAMRLALLVLFKQLSRLSELVKEMRDRFLFKRYDYRTGYTRQHVFFQPLLRNDYPAAQQQIVDQVFLHLAGSFLSWQHHEHGGFSGSSFTFYNFSLIKTPPLLELRKKILNRVFELLSVYREQSLAVLAKYTWSGTGFDISVFVDEQSWFSDKLVAHLQPSNYTDAKIVEDYVDRLKDEKITITHDWKAFLDTDLMKTASLFTFSLKDEEEKLSIEEAEKRKRESIAELIKGKDLTFLSELLGKAEDLYQTNDNHYVETALGYLFNGVADQDIALYLKLIEHILIQPYKFQYTYASIIWYPLTQSMVVKKDFYELINRYDYAHKQYWKQIFFQTLEESEITEYFFFELVGFFHSLHQPIIFPEFKVFAKFNPIYLKVKEKLPATSEGHDHIIEYLTAVLLVKSETISLFMGYDFCQQCKDYFQSNLSLLKKAYIYMDSHRQHYDYTSKEIKAVCEKDENFIVDYISQKANDEDFLQFNSDMLKLDFMWRLPSYESLIDQIMEVIIEKERLYSDLEHPANNIFKNIQTADKETALNYVSRFIQLHHQKDQHVAIIMNVVTYTFYDQLFRFLRELLMLNKDPEMFDSLFLYQNHVLQGSAVPDIDNRIQFYEKVRDMIQTLPNLTDYATHIHHCEEEIEFLRKRKLDEMKRDFGGWGL